MLVVVVAGTLAGLVLFAVQHFSVIPLIKSAESYEKPEHHDDGNWHPADGWERTSLTAIATVLSSIGFAALLFGSAALTGSPLNAKRGALWGLAAFVCFSLAPALGLPPQPPGVPVADVHERQLWWVGTAVATAIGLWLLAGRTRSWLLRLGGVMCVSLPHLIGAPAAPGQNVLPVQLLHQFTVASVATTGVFWLLLGTIGGLIWSSPRAQPHRRWPGPS
jgi:cobalt transporter subunit CbtA